MDTNLDVLGIIKRAKQALNLKRDSELAEYLGVSRATVTNWGARNSIDFRLLLDKLGDKVDYNWLLLGKGNPKHQPRHCESELVQGEVEIIHNPKTPEPIDDRSVTLYDITAAANLKTLFTNKKPCQSQVLPIVLLMTSLLVVIVDMLLSARKLLPVSLLEK